MLLSIAMNEAQLDFFDFAGLAPTASVATLVEAPPEPVAPANPAPSAVVYVRNLRAKNYRLTLRKDGVPVATIPARGTEKAARKFVKENEDWLRKMQDRHRKQPRMA